MLSFSNVAEALTWLSRTTDQDWTESRLFDVAATNGIELHAAVPLGVTTVTTRRISEDASYLENIPDHPLALLPPRAVKRLGLAGVTETNLAADIDGELGEYSQLSSPVRVTPNEVRVSATALQKIAAVADAPDAIAAGPKAVQRSAAQDAALLQEIGSLGFSPMALPPNLGGRRGVKALVRDALLKKHKEVFGSVRVFNHTWQRLRDRGEIANSGARD